MLAVYGLELADETSQKGGGNSYELKGIPVKPRRAMALDLQGEAMSTVKNLMKTRGMVTDKVGAGELRLWSYNFIAVCALFLGMPGGFALALVNWKRMGPDKRFDGQFRVALLVHLAFFAPSFILPPVLAFWIQIAISTFSVVYLRVQLKKDMATLETQGITIKGANLLLGIGMSLGVTLVVLVLFALVYGSVMLIFARF